MYLVLVKRYLKKRREILQLKSVLKETSVIDLLKTNQGVVMLVFPPSHEQPTDRQVCL